MPVARRRGSMAPPGPPRLITTATLAIHERSAGNGANTTFVIVGAGLAGAKAAEVLRAEGFDGPVMLIGDGDRAAV